MNQSVLRLNEIPSDAICLEVFSIKNNGGITEAYIGFRHPINESFNFSFVQVPFTQKMSQVSDGYHTFDELYDHRIILFVKLCEAYNDMGRYIVWKSKLHHDGSAYEGWFIMGIGTMKGDQMTYHLPMKFWEETEHITELDKAPEWDGHTSNDVLERLKLL